MVLTTKDYRYILEIIETASSIHDRAPMFQAVCEKLERLIHHSSAVFIPVDPRTAHFQFEGRLLFRSPAKSVLLFCLYYAPLHPAVQNRRFLSHLNRSIRITDLIPTSRLVATEYGRDFQPTVPVFFELFCPLSPEGNPSGFIGLYRQKHERDFSSRDKQIMDTLLPHLSRAFHNNHPLKEKGPSREGGMIPTGGNVGSFPIYNLRSNLSHFGLSRRQEEIALLVICGLSNHQIAERLFLTEQTVKDHLRRVYKKCRVRRRNELTAKVLRLQSRDFPGTDEARKVLDE